MHEPRTVRRWLADTLSDALDLVIAGLIACVVVGLIAGHLWLLVLIIPGAALWRLQNPRNY